LAARTQAIALVNQGLPPPVMRRYRRQFVTALLSLLLVFIVVGIREARSDPVVRHAHIKMIGADPNAPALRLVLVADLHVGNLAMPIGRLDRIVDQINAQRADAVLVAGDFLNGEVGDSGNDAARDLVAPPSRLHAPQGVYAVLGNHDRENGITRPGIEEALRDAGIDLLNDRAVRLGPIALVGMSWESMRINRIDPVLADARRLGGFPVLLTHVPPFNGMVPRNIPLILAGHTHCGQVVVGGWDNSFSLLSWGWRFPPKLRCGIGHIKRQIVVVSGGVGASSFPPIRFDAPPDFWVLTLQARSDVRRPGV